MEHKFSGSPKSKVVSVTSLTGSTVSAPQPKAGRKTQAKAVPSVRGNRTAFRRIQLAHNSPTVVNSVLDMSRCRMPPSPTEQSSPLQQPKKLKELRFLCSDQQIVTVSCSLMFRYTEELRPFREEDLPIELSSIRSETLLRAIRWMRQHKQEESTGCCGDVDSRWEEELLEGNGDPCQLMELIMAAHHLGLGILARHASEYMEERMAEKTESETRLMQQISLNLAQDEHRP